MNRLGKHTIVLFVGSDARPPYVNGAWPWSSAKAMNQLTKKIRRRIHRFENAGVICINAPGTAQFHRRPVINWFALGFPCTIADRKGTQDSILDQPLRADTAPSIAKVKLLHSPSNPRVKGTERIERMISSLLSRGLQIEWETISGLSNAEVLEAIRRCDLVVDQLFSDTPMAGLATEAAQLGKPAIVGSYLARTPGLIAGNWPMPPSRFVDPDQFESALEDLVRDPQALRSLGTAALNFVESAWSCEAVAGRVAACIKGEIPDDWWFDPSTTTYLQGCGLEEAEGRRRVRELVEAYGENALGLNDKPSLVRAYLNWARPDELKSVNV